MKKISVNFIYNLCYKVLLIITPLITTPYLSRKLGPEAIGAYSYIATLVSMFILVGSLGTSLYARRGIAQRRDDFRGKNNFFKEVYIIRLLGTLICFIPYIIISFCSENSVLYFICGVEICANIFDISWLYEGEEDFGKILVRNIILKFMTILLIFALVKSPNDLWLYAGIRALSILVSNLSMWLFVRRYISFKTNTSLNIRVHIRPVFELLIPQISTQLYSHSDKLMLKWIKDSDLENGYYEQTYKIIEMCLVFISALNASIMPRLSYLYSTDRKNEYRSLFLKTIHVAMMLLFPMTIGLCFISDEFVVLFFGAGFSRVGLLLKLYSPYLVIAFITGFIAQQYLVVTGQEKRFSKLTTLGVVINITLNLIILRHLGSTGAVLSTLLSEIALAVVSLRICSKDKIINLKELFDITVNYAVACIIMASVLFVLDRTLIDGFLSLSIKVIVGVFVYFIVLISLKDKTLKFILQRIFRIYH